MLTSRILPPPVLQSLPSFPPPQAPIATFFHVPRRYVKSNMHADESASHSPLDKAKSTCSFQKNSGIQVFRSTRQEEEPTSPAVSSPRAARKRFAPLKEVTEEDSVDNNSPEDRCPPSATSTGSGEFSSHACLCQPEPKIPRPRNAFILYRQHHQQGVIARTPGLNSPDISKIIGDLWNSESEETKKIWQDQAQEEKLRHQEQYPDYRYQPRRLGKSGSSSLNPTGQHVTADKLRCHRCGGRSIKTPTSPYFDPARTMFLPPVNNSDNAKSTVRYLPGLSKLSIQSPRGRGPGPSGLSRIHVPSVGREDGAMYSPLTPGLKRRRFDGIHQLQNSPRRDSFSPILVRRESLHDALMLPPGTPRDSRQHLVMNLNVEQNGLPRSVGETILSIPYQSKIKLLGRITPPYKGSTPASPVRGAIVAIEGDDVFAVRELTKWLNEFLTKHDDYYPKVVEPPPSPQKENVDYVDYFRLIQSWHGKSKGMIKYITTPVTLALPEGESDEDSLSDKEPCTILARKDSATPSHSSSSSSSSRSPHNAPKPIVLLPTFQLHASVAYASRIPVQDAYSVTDHWQWMATMWRGTVGPDLTIYIRTCEGKGGLGGSKSVELDEAVRCLTVVKEREGGFGEGVLRRVGFEVSEVIRGVGGRVE